MCFSSLQSEIRFPRSAWSSRPSTVWRMTDITVESPLDQLVQAVCFTSEKVAEKRLVDFNTLGQRATNSGPTPAPPVFAWYILMQGDRFAFSLRTVMQGLFFSLTHKLAGLSAPGSVKAESAYLLLFFVPFSFFFMIVASDCVAETHKKWHKRRKMCPRCCINREMSLNATKRLWFSVSFQRN